MTNQAAVDQGLAAFVEAARSAFGPDLRSVVLFGSAAEGRLRQTSDVNVIVVLRAFDPAKADKLREPLRDARTAIALMPMFILEAEIAAAVAAFAVKFADIGHRHKILHGDDPFAGLVVPRDARIARLRQITLNQVLRLRERYIERSLREEQLIAVIAEAAGPLRSAASSLLELEARPAASPKEALEAVAGPARADVMRRLSQAREQRELDPGTPAATLLSLVDVAHEMHERAARLVSSEGGPAARGDRPS